jgi:hypothetical protein
MWLEALSELEIAITGLSSERASHRDRTTNSRPRLLKKKQYLVKRPRNGLDTKTF